MRQPINRDPSPIEDFDGNYESKLYIYCGKALRGKTAFLVATAADLSKKGKKVLYLNDTDSRDSMEQRLGDTGEDIDFKSMLDFPSIDNVASTLEGNIGRHDVIIADCCSPHAFALANYLADYSAAYNVTTLMSVQANIHCKREDIFLAYIW